MANVYYLIWTDAIISFKKYNPKRKDWKFTLWFFISWMNALNFWIVLIWLKYFKMYVIPIINIDIFPGTLLNDFCSFSIEFAFPFGIVNYFLIFHKNRYEKIIIRHRNDKIRYAPIYTFVMAILAFASFIIYLILN